MQPVLPPAPAPARCNRDSVMRASSSSSDAPPGEDVAKSESQCRDNASYQQCTRVREDMFLL